MTELQQSKLTLINQFVVKNTIHLESIRHALIKFGHYDFIEYVELTLERCSNLSEKDAFEFDSYLMELCEVCEKLRKC